MNEAIDSYCEFGPSADQTSADHPRIRPGGPAHQGNQGFSEQEGTGTVTVNGIVISGPLRGALPVPHPRAAARQPEIESRNGMEREELPVIAVPRMGVLMIEHHIEG